MILGVEDDGKIVGVPEGAVSSIQRNIANVARNPKLFDPAVVLETEAIPTGNATVVRVWVPMSPTCTGSRALSTTASRTPTCG